jgi:hypothetical protein
VIIVPTEKSFDWSHTPAALFSIVLLNLLVYFFYQTGDSTRLQQAVERYQQLDYLRLELPVYTAYTRTHAEPSQAPVIEDIRQDIPMDETIIMEILTDTGFTQYL